ncbi:MAG: nucleotidyltransferase [Eubacteriaceae bacterium]|nr:nucleotidyltransferase [Eubacteriaceae bacterium]
MKVLGIVAEYNPFHNGHLYHLKKSIELTGATHSIAVMSGNFLQRGEPALMDKWTRARTAVKNGIDLVIELPYVYCCQSAEIFAYGSVNILNRLNIIDTIAFGSEHENLHDLLSISDLLAEETEEFKIKLKSFLKEGLSFPMARQKALQVFIKNEDIINNPNIILAVEYLKWLKRLDSDIVPVIVKRSKAGYHSNVTVEGIAGATYIRNLIRNEKNYSSELKSLVPETTYQEINEYTKDNRFNDLDQYYEILTAQLLKADPEELRHLPDISEGLENRILSAARNSSSMESLIHNSAAKRYTATRIRRILCNLLMNNTKLKHKLFFMNKDYQPYIRILSFNDKGKELIRRIKAESQCPVITNISKIHDLDELNKISLNMDILSTDLYFLKTNPSRMRSDYLITPRGVSG